MVKHFRKWIKNKICRIKALTIALDTNYYRNTYPDLIGMTDKALKRHWTKYGYREGRKASVEHAAGSFKLNSTAEKILNQSTFEPEFYMALYDGMKAAGITSSSQAEAHYRKLGRKRGFYPNFDAWLKLHGLENNITNELRSWKQVLSDPTNISLNITLHNLLDTLEGKQFIPVKFAGNNSKNSDIYYRLAHDCLLQGDKGKARSFLQLSLKFKKSCKAYELLANTYLDDGHFSIALGYYDEAMNAGKAGKWVYVNRARCFVGIQQADKALVEIKNGISEYPEWTFLHDQLNDLCNKLWMDYQGWVNHRVDADDRKGMLNGAHQYAEAVYKAYLHTYGVDQNPGLGEADLSRILIIGDYHVKQCVRYRIDQKIEQLKANGKYVKSVDWTKLEQDEDYAAFYDAVVFYRVPATPSVLKVMAQVNALGRLSIYELDDLLFEPVYPPAIESYGGYVDLPVFRELTKGMALFNAAARHCRIGIASTEPLAEKLKDLVFGKQVILHRNGLDSLNIVAEKEKTIKDNIDVFYGSATHAHNEDFVSIALPAIQRILDKYKHVRLNIVGYLKLPKQFIEKYGSQLIQYPPTKTVGQYWDLLKKSDINLAVLHSDPINDCKSELKWFEAACFEVPSIVSATKNYKDVVVDGEDAFIATKDDEWFEALESLINDAALREKMGQVASQRVQREYGLEVLGVRLVKALEDYSKINITKEEKTKLKKIALVNVFFAPQSIGGATRVVEDNYKVLREDYADRFELCVFTSDSECRTPYRLTVTSDKGVNVYRTTAQWRENMDWHPKDSRMFRIFSNFIKHEKPDLIHFHCIQRLTGSVVEAAKFHNIPYIITAHDAWWISDYQFLVDEQGNVYPEGHPDGSEIASPPKGVSVKASAERKEYLKHLLNSAYQVLTVSDSFAEIYRKNGINNIEVTKNGISNAVAWRAKSTGYTGKVVCGHVGGMSAHKGYFLLKKAVYELQPTNIEFLVVDHSKDEGYESHENWGNVSVTFIGRVAQGDVVNLYSKIDVLMAPSTWPESFGLVTREAAACGCWVVASNLGGIGDDVDDGIDGYIIAPTNQEICAVLEKLDANYIKYKQPTGCHDIYYVDEQVRDIVGYL